MGIKGYVVRWVGSGDGKRWCDSPGEAAAEAWGRSLSDRCSDVAIFRVHDDGREERLPSYEEALALLGADPLAALEAAEVRLLEAGGWTEEGPDKWSLEGVTWDRRDAVGIARYHAAKGGA